MTVTLASLGGMLDAIAGAKRISLGAYVLSRGKMLGALAAAARHGASVRVVLAADGPAGVNETASAELRAAGAEVRLEDPAQSPCAPLHAKMAVVDGVAYLDDCNWTTSAGDTIVRDGAARDVAAVESALDCGRGVPVAGAVATCKRDALAQEAALFDDARCAHDGVAVESESLGWGNAAYRELEVLAKSGAHPRLLVSQRDLLGNPLERKALERLCAAGASVRVTAVSNEKFAVAGSSAWIGSANATVAFRKPDQIDWGTRTSDARIVRRLHAAFERRWTAAEVFS